MAQQCIQRAVCLAKTGSFFFFTFNILYITTVFFYFENLTHTMPVFVFALRVFSPLTVFHHYTVLE